MECCAPAFIKMHVRLMIKQRRCNLFSRKPSSVYNETAYMVIKSASRAPEERRQGPLACWLIRLFFFRLSASFYIVNKMRREMFEEDIVLRRQH